MPTFHLAFRTAGGASPALIDAASGQPPTTPAPLTAPSRLAVRTAANGPALVSVQVDPSTLTITAAAGPAALHFLRLADATVRPLPPAPAPLPCQPGDAYLAVTPAAARLAQHQPGGASAALARFIHLRDYFNADKLAAALLSHLNDLAPTADPTGAGVLVIELR